MLHALQSYSSRSCSPAELRYASDCGAKVIASVDIGNLHAIISACNLTYWTTHTCLQPANWPIRLTCRHKQAGAHSIDGNAKTPYPQLEFLRISLFGRNCSDVLRWFLQLVQQSGKGLGKHEDFGQKSTSSTNSFCLRGACNLKKEISTA